MIKCSSIQVLQATVWKKHPGAFDGRAWSRLGREQYIAHPSLTPSHYRSSEAVLSGGWHPEDVSCSGSTQTWLEEIRLNRVHASLLAVPKLVLVPIQDFVGTYP